MNIASKEAFETHIETGRWETDLEIMQKTVEHNPNLTDLEYAKKLDWKPKRASQTLSDLKCKLGTLKFGWTRHCTVRGIEKPKVNTWCINDNSDELKVEIVRIEKSKLERLFAIETEISGLRRENRRLKARYEPVDNPVGRYHGDIFSGK